MFTQLKNSLIAIGIFSLLLGIAYPALMVVVAMVIAPSKSTGSIVTVNGKAVGSELIGQQSPGLQYFYGRPSAGAYGTIASAASNLGPTSKQLHDNIKTLRDSISKRDDIQPADIAPDLLTTSGSGLDPHISVDAAMQQVRRVAKQRGITERALQDLVNKYTTGRDFAIFGQPRVNVLMLNLALDGMYK